VLRHITVRGTSDAQASRIVLAASLISFTCVWAVDGGGTPDGAYQSRSEWDEATQGPMPRQRAGGTPPPDPNQSLTPYAVQLPLAAPEAGFIESPPEYSPADGVLFRYSTGAWPVVVTDLVAALTGDPTHDEIAYVVVSSASQQSSAQSQFLAAGADLSKVEFIVMPTDSIWLRDYGPHFVWQDGADAIVDSHYYPNRSLDNFIPTLLGDDRFIIPTYDIGLYYSGGNFQPGANRFGFVTALIHTDNPGFGEAFIGELYEAYQGIDTLHIFPQLPSSVDGTGHIDMWLYLVDEDTVIISEFLPGSNATAIAITDNAATYMQDTLGYEVFRVPDHNGFHPAFSPAHYTYTNAFRVNERIFIPTYGAGDPSHLGRDADALHVWQQAAPGVEIVPIDSYDIIWAAGAIHCIVMQVPRYEDPLPSAHVISPSGGELLVPGTMHEVTWTAKDDAEVDLIDILYSTDDGLTYNGTVVLGETDDGRHDWLVPPVEDDEMRVKLIAYDADTNSVEAVSETAFTIMGSSQRVYDLGTGIVNKGWGYQTSSWAQLDGVRRPTQANTEIAALQNNAYARMAASDATGGDGDPNRYRSPSASGGSETTHIFEFLTVQDPDAIVDIGVLWEGYGDAAIQMELYVWDYVAGQWCDGRGQCGENRFMDNFAGNRDAELTGHIRSDFDRFIDPVGWITLLVYGERSGQESFHDSISVTLTWDNCPDALNPDQADGDLDTVGDACDNCVFTVNRNQENSDGDTRGDACDCAPLDGTAFDVPFEIESLLFTDATTFQWDSDAPNSGSGTVYDVMRGDVSGLSSGYAGSCIDPQHAGVSTTDTDPLPAGQGRYYLVRGSNACGDGSYGTDSDSAERISGACP